jgi:hypothetical protein
MAKTKPCRSNLLKSLKMRTNLFTSSVTFNLCELDSDGTLADTVEITVQNITIVGMTYLNSYVRQHYLDAQNNAVKHWSPKERQEFLKLAMANIVKLHAGTKEGNEILFNTLDGMLHYTWVYVKHRFPAIQEWDAVLRSNSLVYEEIMNRFNKAMCDLAVLTSEETGGEQPDNQDTEYIDDLIARLIASGISPENAMKLTIEQAYKVLGIKNGDEPAAVEPVAQTNNPEELKEILRQKLEGQNNEPLR